MRVISERISKLGYFNNSCAWKQILSRFRNPSLLRRSRNNYFPNAKTEKLNLSLYETHGKNVKM